MGFHLGPRASLRSQAPTSRGNWHGNGAQIVSPKQEGAAKKGPTVFKVLRDQRTEGVEVKKRGHQPDPFVGLGGSKTRSPFTSSATAGSPSVPAS